MPDPQQRWPDDMPLEAQLGNALGLALAFLKSGDWNNQDMARIEAPFKAWCDQVVDGPAVPEGREPASVVSEPSDEEIEEWADACPEAPLEEMDPEVHGWRRCFTAKEFSETIRAALARWGHHPEPVPVSERLPGPEDCIPHPRTKLGKWCWGFERCEVSLARPARWRLMHIETIELEASHWLPAHALPLPAGEVQP